MKKRYSITILLVVILLGWSVLHEAGAVILRHYNLQLRPWVQTVSAGIRYGLFLLLIVMAAVSVVLWMKERPSAWGKAGAGLAAVFGAMLFAGAVYVGLIALTMGHDKEHIGEYRDKRCVVREERWHHQSYYYYEYKGWFFMGDELLGAEQMD